MSIVKCKGEVKSARFFGAIKIELLCPLTKSTVTKGFDRTVIIGTMTNGSLRGGGDTVLGYTKRHQLSSMFLENEFKPERRVSFKIKRALSSWVCVSKCPTEKLQGSRTVRFTY